MTPRPAIIVPLYQYPLTPATWEPLHRVIRSHLNLNFVVIVNPNSGPGDDVLPDESYSRELPKFNGQTNVCLMGYVRIDYCRRSVNDVCDDVKKYAGWSCLNEDNDHDSRRDPSPGIEHDSTGGIDSKSDVATTITHLATKQSVAGSDIDTATEEHRSLSAAVDGNDDADALITTGGKNAKGEISKGGTQGLAVQGIFLDETPNEYSTQRSEYLETVSRYVRRQRGILGKKLVIHNPGCTPSLPLLASCGDPDIIAVVEESHSRYLSTLVQQRLNDLLGPPVTNLEPSVSNLTSRFDVNTDTDFQREKCAYIIHSIPNSQAARRVLTVAPSLTAALVTTDTTVPLEQLSRSGRSRGEGLGDRKEKGSKGSLLSPVGFLKRGRSDTNIRNSMSNQIQNQNQGQKQVHSIKPRSSNLKLNVHTHLRSELQETNNNSTDDITPVRPHTASERDDHGSWGTTSAPSIKITTVGAAAATAGHQRSISRSSSGSRSKDRNNHRLSRLLFHRSASSGNLSDSATTTAVTSSSSSAATIGVHNDFASQDDYPSSSAKNKREHRQERKREKIQERDETEESTIITALTRQLCDEGVGYIYLTDLKKNYYERWGESWTEFVDAMDRGV